MPPVRRGAVVPLALLLTMLTACASTAAAAGLEAGGGSQAGANSAPSSANVDAIRGLALLVALAVGALLFGGDTGGVVPPRTPVGQRAPRTW